LPAFARSLPARWLVVEASARRCTRAEFRQGEWRRVLDRWLTGGCVVLRSDLVETLPLDGRSYWLCPPATAVRAYDLPLRTRASRAPGLSRQDPTDPRARARTLVGFLHATHARGRCCPSARGVCVARWRAPAALAPAPVRGAHIDRELAFGTAKSSRGS